MLHEHRLLGYNVSDFGTSQTKAKAAITQKVNTTQTLIAGSRTSQANEAAAKAAYPGSRVNNVGQTGASYKANNGLSPIAINNGNSYEGISIEDATKQDQDFYVRNGYHDPGMQAAIYNLSSGMPSGKQGETGVMYYSASQERSAADGRVAAAVDTDVANYENSLRNSGMYDPYLVEQYRATKSAEAQAQLDRNAASDNARKNQEAIKQGQVTTPTAQTMKTAKTGGNADGTPSWIGTASSVQTRSQRLGLSPKAKTGTTTQPPSQTKATPAPVVTPTGTPSPIPAATQSSQDASDALSGGTVELPTSMKQIADEESAAITPLMDSLTKVRNGFMIMQGEGQSLIDDRAAALEKWKNESIDRQKQIAAAKISTSKASADAQLEIAKEGLDRQTQYENILGDKQDRDYARLEERQRMENEDSLMQMRTANGARYGGFGSTRGLELISNAEKQASLIMSQIQDDKTTADQKHAWNLQKLESDYKTDVSTIFSTHNKNVSDAYNTLADEAQKIDDKELTEEGELTKMAKDLLTNAFNKFADIELDTGKQFVAANQRVIDQRDKINAQNFTQKHQSLQTLFSGISAVGTSNPVIQSLEKAAGIVPGTLSAMPSLEERRIAISQAGLRIQQGQYQLAIDKAVGDGYSVSVTGGVLTTNTGQLIRDAQGNPIMQVSPMGTVTSSQSNDRVLFGDSAVSMHTTAGFAGWAQGLGSIIPGSPFHKGGEYDIAGKYGSPVTAAMTGRVLSVDNVGKGELGINVKVQDANGNVWTYGHLEKTMVKPGQTVSAESNGVLGLMGNTGQVLRADGSQITPGTTEGTHVHVQVNSPDGSLVDPMDSNMQPGSYFSNGVTWVDSMRSKLASGQVLTGPTKSGKPMTTGTSGMSWKDVDAEVLSMAEQTFRTRSGAVDYKAVNLVHQYLLDHKMGNYSISSKGTTTVNEKNVQTAIKNVGMESAISLLQDGTFGNMSEDEATSYVKNLSSGSDTLQSFLSNRFETPTEDQPDSSWWQW